MRYLKTKRFIALVILLTAAAVAPASIPATQASDDNRTPDLPSPACDKIQAPQGNKVAFHVYAKGSQIYKWNGIKWDFVGPVATLYADTNPGSMVDEVIEVPYTTEYYFYRAED